MITYTLRPAKGSDREWVWETKKRCFSTYVKQTFGVWNEETQTSRFNATFDSKEIRIINISENAVGYIAYVCTAEELRLFNIMILPEFQNRGLGSAIMRNFLKEAETKRIPFRLQVLKVNPARRLYERLGLNVTGHTDVHYQMQWIPLGCIRRTD